MVERRIPREFSKFMQEIKNKGCQTLGNPSYEIHVDIIREFHVIAKPLEEDLIMARTSWVRGRAITYDRDVIRDYFEYACELLQGGLYGFSWEVHRMIGTMIEYMTISILRIKYME